MKLILFIILFFTLPNLSDTYTIHEIYKKVELEDGVLGPDGDEIEFIFQKTSLKEGKYEIEITDGPGDLYKVKNSSYFLKFNGYYGYAGYGDPGILIIGTSSYNNKFVKTED